MNTSSSIGLGWTVVRNQAAHQVALKLARGTYQRSLLLGFEAWSGSTLKGAARGWGARYYASRTALSARLHAAGIPMAFETIGRRKVAVIG
jgi:hypothetical protein